MTKQTPIAVHITTGTTGTPITTVVTAKSCMVHQIVIAVGAIGTTWNLRVQSRAGVPNTLVTVHTLTAPTDGKPNIIRFEEPIPAPEGVEVITAGTTAGNVDVYVTVSYPS